MSQSWSRLAPTAGATTPIIDGHIHRWPHDTDFYSDIAWREAGEGRLPPHPAADRALRWR